MDPVQSKLLVDGWVFVSEDYEVMGTNNMMLKNKGVKVIRVTERTYKGVRRLHGREGAAITLGFGDTQMRAAPAECYLLVTGPTGGEQLNLERIKSVYLESVDVAINSLEESSKTKKDWNILYGCHTFSEQETFRRDRPNCSNCPHSLVVQPIDYAQFGRSMNDSMRQKLGPDYNICLLIKRFGQSEPLSFTKRTWRFFRPALCEEIVVHLAKDFWQEGKCMLWKTSAVNVAGYFGQKNIFNNFLLGGHASFEFDGMRKYGHGVQLPGPGVMFYANLKFYIDPFKEIHRGSGEPWKHPEVERCFTNLPSSSRVHTPPSTLLAWLGQLKRARETVEKQGFNYARCEAIMNMSGNNLGFDNEDEINVQTIMQRFERFFQDNFGHPRQGVRSHLASFDFRDFLQHVDETLMRAVYTLEGLVLKVDKMRKDKKNVDVTLPNIEDIILGVACEVLISFGVYGCINYFPAQNGARHDRRWRETLNLKPATLEKQRRAFEGLRNIQYVDARGENGAGQFGGIVYKGPIYLKMHLSKALEEGSLAEENVRELVRLIREVHENILVEHRANDQMVPVYKQIAYYLWNELAKPMFVISNDQRGVNRDPDDFMRLAQNCVLEGQKLCFQNSCEFLRRLFRMEEHKSNFALGYCVKQLRHVLSTANVFGEFLELVATYVDVELYKSRGLALMYSWGTDIGSGEDNISYVLPCVGNLEDSYEFTSGEAYHQDLALKQQLVRQQWEFAYKRTYRANVRDQQASSFILQEALTFPSVMDPDLKAGALLDIMFKLSLKLVA